MVKLPANLLPGFTPTHGRTRKEIFWQLTFLLTRWFSLSDALDRMQRKRYGVVEERNCSGFGGVCREGNEMVGGVLVFRKEEMICGLVLCREGN